MSVIGVNRTCPSDGVTSASDPKRTSGAPEPIALLTSSIAYYGVLQWIDPKSGGLMRRRDFIAGIAGLAAPWPLAARAQQAMPVIGYLGSTSMATSAPNVAAFRQALKENG